jgi:hypothetical protein
MNIRDRLMSRASVAAMAAFAPKPEGGLPAGAERVEDAGGDDGGADDGGLGLSADEQAAFDAMQAGRDPSAKEDIVQPGEADGGDDNDEPDAGDDATGADDGAAAAAAGDGEPAPAAADGAKPPKTISYGKYQREQAKTKKALEDLQAKLDGATKETAREREQRLRLDERTRLLLDAINTKQPAAAAAAKDEDPEPDAEADPIGNLQWHNKKLREEVNGLRTGTQQREQQTAAEREEAQLYQTYEADLMRAAQGDPTFGDAFNHLRETRYTELGFIYADVDINDKAAVDAALTPEQQVELSQNIQRTFHNEQMLVARQALQAKKSPAMVVKNLARARGFKPQAAAAQQQDPAAAAAAAAADAAKPANGGRTAPVAPGSVKDQLQAIRDGQESSRSLSDAGGSPGGSITPERLVEMGDDEFNELYESMSKGKFDRLMGKPATQ